ncbi:hypothetical protein K1719_022121 [Acacia pycnantha]|nr:hypothetical protein K1719_022121 [Acacia pycnantha]
MATARPKEKSAVGKEKVLPSNSQSSTSTKKTTKPCAPSGKPTSSSEKEKQIPNYLKATVSSSVESHSPQKTAVNRRRSLDKPTSSSTLTKHNQSSSRLHKALVSPGPRERSASQILSLPSASEKTSRTSRDGKLSTNTKSVNISRKSPNPTPKKVASDGSTTANSTKAPKSGAETKERFKNVETEAEVKHAANEKVEEVVMEDDNKQEENENATDQINPPIVDTENEHEHKKEHEQDQMVEESKPGEPQTQADNNNNNNVIPTASEEEEQQEEEEEEEAKAVSVPEEIKQVVEVEEAKREDPPEEKAEDVHQEGENENPEEIIDHPEPEEQKVDVEEKEEENHTGVTEEMEKENNKEEKTKEKKEVAEGETDGVKLKKGEDDDHNVEKREVKEENAELKPKQQGAAGVHGKKETTQVSNDVIEETASKLEKRTNKVRALAGAFQTVIDHQSN